MDRLMQKSNNRMRRKARIRKVVSGTATRPRLAVNISTANVSAQLIDDEKQITLAAVSTIGTKSPSGTMTEKAAWVGEQIAKKAKALKVNQIVLDRGGKLYHGRVKALADKAREGGLEF